jgi:hypothetical protein
MFILTHMKFVKFFVVESIILGSNIRFNTDITYL